MTLVLEIVVYVAKCKVLFIENLLHGGRGTFNFYLFV